MQQRLTLEQKATNNDTWWHIHRVRQLLNVCIRSLLDRSDEHDLTKLSSPEVELFSQYTDKLAQVTYGSSEYAECLEAIQPALEHHYARYRHHPQHSPGGVNDMNLIDLLEMFCDWKASSERHTNGNILRSIEINADRFGISPQLQRILENTAKVLDNH